MIVVLYHDSRFAEGLLSLENRRIWPCNIVVVSCDFEQDLRIHLINDFDIGNVCLSHKSDKSFFSSFRFPTVFGRGMLRNFGFGIGKGAPTAPLLFLGKNYHFDEPQ